MNKLLIHFTKLLLKNKHFCYFLSLSCLSIFLLAIYRFIIRVDKVFPSAFFVKKIVYNEKINAYQIITCVLISSVIMLTIFSFKKNRCLVGKFTISLLPALLMLFPYDNYLMMLIFVFSSGLISYNLSYYFLKRIKIALNLNNKSVLTILISAFLIMCGYGIYLQNLHLNSGQLHYSDWGIFLNVTDNTLKGKLFFSNQLNYNFMGQHFMPVLIGFLLPFVALFRFLNTIFVLNSVILFANCLIVYYFCRAKKLSKMTALIAALIILFTPSLLNLNLAMFYGFHGVYIIIPFVLTLWILFEKKHYIWSMILFILILLTKETTAPMFFGVGLYFLCQKKFKTALLLFTISTIYFIVVTKFIMPNLLPESLNKYGFFSYYKSLGNSYGEILLSPITRAKIFWGRIFHINSINYTLTLLLPFSYLIWRKPTLLFGGLIILIFTLLMDVRARINIELQYQSCILPFIFLAFIYGLVKLKNNHKTLKASIIACFVSTFLLNYYLSPYPFTARQSLQRNEHDIKNFASTIKIIKQHIPIGEKITADEKIAAPLVLRNDTYLNFKKPQNYVILQFNSNVMTPEDVAKNRFKLATEQNYKLLTNHKIFDQKGKLTNTMLLFQKVAKNDSDINNQKVISNKSWSASGGLLRIIDVKTKQPLNSANAKVALLSKSNNFNLLLRKNTQSSTDYAFIVKISFKDTQIYEYITMFNDGALPFYLVKNNAFSTIKDESFNKILNNGIKESKITNIEIFALPLSTQP
ncbi:DUF2079 domain-containing protein [Lentisphaerota bacterium WC36G]|nr:DUF2079 domain-containing protein [Lentisphaerae bacterium WC36]